MSQQIEQPALESLVSGLNKRLTQIESNLRFLLEALKPGPEYQRTIWDYPAFDWSEIGAKVIGSDQWGATLVEWNGKRWKRRAPDNKYGADIWFSRCIGKENNENVYAELIKFSEKRTDDRVDPLGKNAMNLLREVNKATQRQPQAVGARSKQNQVVQTTQSITAKDINWDEGVATDQETIEEIAPPPAPSAPLTVSETERANKARAYVSMQQVRISNDNSGYQVGKPSSLFMVKRGAGKQPATCTCAELPILRKEDPEARCAHIMAVRLFVSQQPERV
jgi:hypothetical protein